MGKWRETWKVRSSDGKVDYTVGLTHEGKWACSCRGWTLHVRRDKSGVTLRDKDGEVLRNDCRHIKEVKGETTKGKIRELDYVNALDRTRDQKISTRKEKPREREDLMTRPVRVIELPDD